MADVVAAWIGAVAAEEAASVVAWTEVAVVVDSVVAEEEIEVAAVVDLDETGETGG